MKRIVSCILFILILTSCSNTSESINPITEPLDEQEAVMVNSNIENVNDEYTIFVEQIYNLAMYEPFYGCYLGANIQYDKKINEDINQFENYVGQTHATYTYEMTLGDPFPIDFILSCIANNKIPNIVVYLPDENLKSHAVEIQNLSREFAKFKVPMFIQFAPYKITYDPEEYIDLFRNTREVFRVNAPNVAFVWTVQAENVFNCMSYYPGDDYVDWVGISGMQSVDSSSDEIYNNDLYNAFNFFYYTFQETKPIMITEFGVSQFSTVDSTYHINEAVNELHFIYTEISTKYPRVKAIYYKDYNDIYNTEAKNNYLLTEDNLITTSYKEETQNDYFLKTYEPNEQEKVNQLIRSPFPAYRVGEEILISENTLIFNFKMEYVTAGLEPYIIDNENYYKLNDLENNLSGNFQVDNINKIILYN